MYEIVTEICEKRGSMDDLDLLGKMAQPMIDGSLCALGKTIPTAVTSTIKYFKKDFVEYITANKAAN